MNIENISEIPRIFTAIAEILACSLYIVPLKKKKDGIAQCLLVLIWSSIIVFVHFIAEKLSIVYWIPGMIIIMLSMFLFILSVCEVKIYKAGFIFVRAFLLAEFAAAFEWQIYYYLTYRGMKHTQFLAMIIMIAIYSLIFTVVYFLDVKKLVEEEDLRVKGTELLNALIIGFATFSINNINFVIDSPFVSNRVGANILYVRTLIDLSGLLVLFAWNEQRRQNHANHELRVINDILIKQYDQYKKSKESIEIINRKYHDLKHQIAIIRNEKDNSKKDEYLNELDYALGVYASQYDTGNAVLDTVLAGKSLYCKEHQIKFNCVANGKVLDFMNAMDICAIFGNALDNAIESVKKIEDEEKRIVRVTVFDRKGFLIMRFINYYNHEIVFQNDIPQTTKSNTHNHGYGIKSIKKSVEKYNGNLSIRSENNWFIVSILIPLE